MAENAWDQRKRKREEEREGLEQNGWKRLVLLIQKKNFFFHNPGKKSAEVPHHELPALGKRTIRQFS